MISEKRDELNPSMQAATEELQALIKSRFPEAEFAIDYGDDPEGVYLRTIVDLEDTDEVIDLVIDRLLEIQIERGLPVYVFPEQTPELSAGQSTRRKALSPRPHT